MPGAFAAHPTSQFINSIVDGVEAERIKTKKRPPREPFLGWLSLKIIIFIK